MKILTIPKPITVEAVYIVPRASASNTEFLAHLYDSRFPDSKSSPGMGINACTVHCQSMLASGATGHLHIVTANGREIEVRIKKPV